MRPLRVAATVVLLVAVAALGADVVRSVTAGAVRIYALGEVWYALHPPSLNLFQAVIQRYVSPALWDPAIVSVLRLPASASFAVPGLVLVWLSRNRRG